jgi:hypothetical protein
MVAKIVENAVFKEIDRLKGLLLESLHDPQSRRRTFDAE